MKVAIYTIVRDRLEYTQHCFKTLQELAGYPYDHFIIDNGSDRDTVDWLYEHVSEFKLIVFETDNTGISAASNIALDYISDGEYDLICKMDNDCEIVTPDLVKSMVELYSKIHKSMLLSPRVSGIDRQPRRVYNIQAGGYTVGRTGIVGGLCHWMLSAEYQQYRYPATLPKAWGQDDDFCNWCYQRGIDIGYVEALEVSHYETTAGQMRRYPEYFARKFAEETLQV